MAEWENSGRCKTRSGVEYSPFANAVALHLPGVHLAQLLERRDDGPDSDTDSLDDSEDDLNDLNDPPQPPKPTHSAAPTPPPRPSTFIRVAPPGHPPGTPLPNGLMPGFVIRVARQVLSPKKATTAEVKARRLLKKHAKDRASRALEREVLRAKTGGRLKGVTRLHVRQAAPALQLSLSIHDLAAPVAASGWQGVRQEEPDAAHHSLEEMRRLRPDMRIFDWDGSTSSSTPTPVIDADHNILLVLGGSPPNDSSWGPDVADNATAKMQEAAIDITGGKHTRTYYYVIQSCIRAWVRFREETSS
ncbi:hypothetical protein C8F04DRAFT_1188014 [Mycena alexandri]|uniref:Uncharacterized protein n=1 Tax=Mycena alexandri TaxID=1745969 RepID=A0AAD6SNT1_9AGAR|nr:hypothetical protein C8F04DRAFT_1188014 [Mycena alexandri]